ncbi:MAG TPA: UbiA family prenyltransferase [Mesorhizobium sp.]|jgi:4-hydroxybenzoate polyprenyltransferase|nr:UbiA family prenyltransferase [Mesorhizobium sp.]
MLNRLTNAAMLEPQDDSFDGVPLQSDVLCVDMDGTYLRTDTLYECLLVALKAKPQLLLHVPFWLAKGRLHLKQQLTKHARGALDLGLCGRQPEVEALVRQARAQGKQVELITAADQALVCDEPSFRESFDAVIGSTDRTNLKAREKAELLRRRHPEGFAYVGNSSADLPVWEAASERFAVNLPNGVRRQAAREGLGLVELAPAAPVLPALLKSMRLHQWLKNSLIFVPLALTITRADLGDIATFLAAFVLFGLLASGTYMVNDLLDLEADRRHPRKRNRPIPSGDLPLPVAGLASIGLIGTALLGAVLISPPFAAALLAYLVVTLAYSLRLKREAMVDVLVIAVLFTLRIVAGMLLVETPLSHWLLMFSMFFFFSLALMKREVELNVMHQRGVQSVPGRGYALDDRILVVCFGVSSGVASLVIFSLFVSTRVELIGRANYGAALMLWGALALLSYWMIRMWLLTTRGQMNDDPILYAVKDRASLMLGATMGLLMLAAQALTL